MPGPTEAILLPPNTIAHFYPGGGALSRFRGTDPGSQPSPEDWVGSTTTRFGQAPVGLSRLEDGSVLRDLVAADPVGFLGPDHVEAFGDDPTLLVKLLDSAARLIVHAHPDREFARHHLGSVHGKTESWIVLSETEGEVFVGFSAEVAEERLATWVREQRADEMLGALNVLRVSRGDSVLVPAGVPHAIGPGVFVVELQEPTDFSIALEQRDLTDPDLGLGWPIALQAIDRSAWGPERLERLRGPGLSSGGRVLPPAADPFFRADLSRPLSASAADASAGGGEGGATVPPTGTVGAGEDELGCGLAILVVLDGTGELVTESARRTVRAGETLLLPYGAGSARLAGGAVVLACRPPAPGPLEPARPLL